jgi:hypothetical protein
VKVGRRAESTGGQRPTTTSAARILPRRGNRTADAGPVKVVKEAGEVGLAAEFDGVIPDETHRRDELRQMLARWP